MLCGGASIHGLSKEPLGELTVSGTHVEAPVLTVGRLCGLLPGCRLDLDAWINEPPSESESEDEKPKAMFTREETKHSRPRHTEVDEKELAKVRPASP